MLIVRAISLALFALLVSARSNCFAQETFKIESSSAVYDVSVKIEKCDEQRRRFNPPICSGPGQVGIYLKGSAFPFQILNFNNLEVDKDQIAYNGKIAKSPRKLYDDEYSLIFDDFNFDGSEDLAVCTGRDGGYRAPSYNVYLFNKVSKKFVENVRLSKLTQEVYLGLFFIEPKKKQLVAHSKSGCCHHETEVYKIIHNRPVLVEKIIEDASGGDATGYVVTVTTRKLVNGKWLQRVKKEKVKEEAP
jgi:hypothetical protein